MGVGLSGMISGLDTDSIVKAMVSGQQAKATKVENKITLNKWTKEAWSGLNTKIYSFYTKYASKLRLQTSYMTRSASSSNESIVKATAGSGAAVGTHSLQVKKLASSQYVTGGQLKKKDENGSLTNEKADYNKNTKLVDSLGVEKGTIFTITGQMDSDKEEIVKLEVTDKTTIDDFLSACKEAGLTASFDTNQQRFFISSSDSGSENKFSIEANTYTYNSTGTGDVFTKLETIKGMVDTSFLSSTDKEKYEDAIATLRENAEVISEVLNHSADDEYVSSTKAYKEVKAAIETVKTMAEKTYADEEATKQELENVLNLVRSGNAKIQYGDSEYVRADIKTEAKNNVEAKLKSIAETVAKEQLGNLEELQKAINEQAKTDGKKYIAVKDLTFAKYEEAKSLIETSNNGTDEEKSKITPEQLDNANAVINTWNYSTADGTIGSIYEDAYEEERGTDGHYNGLIRKEMRDVIIAKEKDYYNEQVAEIKKDILSEANKDAYQTAINGIKANIENALADAVNGLEVKEYDEFMNTMGISNIDGNKVEQAPDGTGMVVVEASNAEFVLDGATMTETSNSFTVNGLTLNLSGTTESKDIPGTFETVQITVGKDVDSTYKLVKEALTEYNKLIEEMNTLYNADSSRGYDPLTDEQKEAMSETDIENWEKKIKDSLLRRDNTLGTLLSSMRNALSTSYTDEDGKTYSLSSYGIVTGHYTEKGKLHIYGDEEDATYATYEDRLKAALEDDPDKVMETLTHVFGNLYSTMTEKCAKTEISSALTFYNDKQYNTLLKDYEDDLDILQDRIKELEDRYYKQFTAMEKAMSVLQNQSNSLASLLGTGQ